MANCIFCRIASGEVEARVVHRDAQCVAFHDSTPQAPVHLLVIPRRHIASLAEAVAGDTELLGHLLQVGRDLAHDMGLETGGFRSVINCGAGAGQSVFHLHLHILGGRPFGWPPG